MMRRSMPPSSAHLALIPVPAPPPMIGLPAATWARSRARMSSRVNMIAGGDGAVIPVSGYGARRLRARRSGPVRPGLGGVGLLHELFEQRLGLVRRGRLLL